MRAWEHGTRPAGTDLLGRHRRRLLARGTAADVIRAAYLADTYATLGIADRVRTTLAYRRQLGEDVKRAHAKHAAGVEKGAGTTVVPSQRQVAAACRRYFLRPKDYYHYRLYDPEAAVGEALLGRLITKFWMFNYLHRGLNVTEESPVTDKMAFADRCAERGVDHASVVASFKSGRVTWLAELPEGDVFVKPVSKKGGSGAAAWAWQPADQKFVRVGSSKSLSLERLVRRYEERSRGEPYLLSPRYVNHPDLQDIGLDALSTVRVIAALNEDDEPEALAAVLRMAVVPGTSVDNGHAGGIAAPVDLETGRLGVASSLNPDKLGLHRQHPATGAAIEGRLVPGWEDVLRLACSAQEAFRPRVVVAWDIAVTERGPIVIEGNSRPGLDLIQQTHGPIGHTRLGELLAYHVTKKAASV